MSKKIFCNEGKHFTCRKIKYIYPDLTEPSNFVKLLKISCKAVISTKENPFFSCLLVTENPIDELINRCIRDIEFATKDINGKDYFSKYRYEIIKQAQQTEWEY
jgi:hypothetical protein